MTQKRPPEQSFPNDQLDVLRVLGRVELSAQPTAREVYQAVAALGGHTKYTAIPAGEPSRLCFEARQSLTAGWANAAQASSVTGR